MKEEMVLQVTLMKHLEIKVAKIFVIFFCSIKVKLVCVVAFVPPMTILAIVVYRKMGYLIFNFIGANLKLTSKPW